MLVAASRMGEELPDQSEALRELQTASAKLSAGAWRAAFETVEQQRRNVFNPPTVREVGFWPLLGAAVLWWLIFVVVMFADYWIFRSLGSNYFHWYLHNGSTIALATAFLALIVPLDLHDDLISAHPLAYLVAIFDVLISWQLVLAAGLKAPRLEQTPKVVLPALFDTIITIALIVVLTGVLAVWALLVVPIQYFVYLVAGAPARAIRVSPEKVWRDEGGWRIVPKETPTPPAAFELRFADKPVSLTNAFAAGLLFAVSQVL
jgi:hypothetical protein